MENDVPKVSEERGPLRRFDPFGSVVASEPSVNVPSGCNAKQFCAYAGIIEERTEPFGQEIPINLVTNCALSESK